MPKTQRVLDPIHGLIVFRAEDEVDQLAWRLVNTREFQRLRQVRQLGFSELVFPGATHTRFSHCIGVFHTARQLLEVIRRKIAAYDDNKARIAVCAALLHDLGHGPFSHTFENVEKRRGIRRSHEEWTADIIRDDTEVRTVLADVSGEFPNQVAELLTQREPRDIYTAIVSSQFDADRLDYLQRDRYMTGAGSGGFDFHWLLDCLEVGRMTIGGAGEADLIEVDGLHLSHKGLQTAEGYLLARYHLYSQVYMHKTTRGAEAMLGVLLKQVAQKIESGQVGDTGLPESHPLVRYYQAEAADLNAYLALDDSIIWSALALMNNAADGTIARLGTGLQNRQLYKCFDAGVLAKSVGGNSLERFRRQMRESLKRLGLNLDATLLTDEAKITPYGNYGFDEPGALQKVLISEKDQPDRIEDIAKRSPVVEAIPEERLFRVYVPTAADVESLRRIWQEVAP